MSDTITFLLNGQKHTAVAATPTVTLLDHLREACSLKGTKEGCAEGDCGACTVAVGEAIDGRMNYRAINACIAFLPALAGKSVVTVEGLEASDGTLHPCQRALADLHGTQCGFCTPGFVMSLYVSYREGCAGNTSVTNDLLAGNLCRCTGYGPIIAAAGHMRLLPRPDWDDERVGREAEMLSRMEDGPATLTTAQGVFHAPRTAADLAGLCVAHPDATILGGGTDAGLWVTKQLRELPVIIHTGSVAELRRITIAGDVLTIGAAATYADAWAPLARHHADLGELIRRIGSVQIRNAGTIGGNIANGSPIGDMAPALMALGARLNLCHGVKRRSLPLEDFFIAYGKQDRAPGEFIESIEVPIGQPREQLKCYKVAKRFDQDISAVCGCFNINVERGKVRSARIAFGGMAGTPKRARSVEASLIGKPWTQAGIADARAAFTDDFQPISDMRASARYRLLTAQNLLVRAMCEDTGPLAETRIVGRGAPWVTP